MACLCHRSGPACRERITSHKLRLVMYGPPHATRPATGSVTFANICNNEQPSARAAATIAPEHRY